MLRLGVMFERGNVYPATKEEMKPIRMIFADSPSREKCYGSVFCYVLSVISISLVT